MELLVIIGAVIIIGYYAYKRYTKDVTVDETIVAPYKMEPPTLEAEPVQEPVDTTKNWPFPTSDSDVPAAAMTAKPKAAPKAKAPAKPKAAPKAKAPAKPKAAPKAKAPTKKKPKADGQ